MRWLLKATLLSADKDLSTSARFAMLQSAVLLPYPTLSSPTLSYPILSYCTSRQEKAHPEVFALCCTSVCEISPLG